MRLFRIPNKINKIVIFHLERYKWMSLATSPTSRKGK